MKDSTAPVTIISLPPSSERLPLFIVGDVHGCSAELSDLIKLAKSKIKEFQLILVGDLFTKGPDPIGIYEQILEHKAICIKGNHDWALKTLITKSHNPHFHIPYHSKQTLKLIRFHKNLIADFIMSLPYALKSIVEPDPPRASWGESYPLIIIHAGMDCLQGLNKTTERMLLTARFVKFEIIDGKKILIPANAIEVENSDPTKVFRWHELHHGPELIVFGHDAKQGLFRKTLENGRPICVGLDTGCTYGKTLTGYFPEKDLALQIKARRTYFDVKENRILIKNKAKQ